LTTQWKKHNNQSGKEEEAGGGNAWAIMWSGRQCRGVANIVERMRAHGGALGDITRAVDLNGAKMAWQL
jgi:hypothetical protein